MSQLSGFSFNNAVQEFRKARWLATLEDIAANFTGKSAALMSYEDVSRKLKVHGISEKGLHEIPLADIVGSVGRYSEFTRTFLPKRDDDEQRWAKVQVATTGLAGVPPIAVYKVGEAYFVIDGNHRVSVARQLGASLIEAHVTEVKTKVPLSPNDQPDDLIRKAEYAEFLNHTQLDESRPQADLTTTAPGKYWILQAQIDALRLSRSLNEADELSYKEAAAQWYDEIYMPLIALIRRRGILRDFPQRTETDFYIWLSDHRAGLKQALGWDIDPDTAMTDLQNQAQIRQRNQLMDYFTSSVLNITMPKDYMPDATTKADLLTNQETSIFYDLLVAINHDLASWRAFEQATTITRHEGGRILGLYVAPSGTPFDDPQIKSLQKQFRFHCEAAQVNGELAIEFGPIADKIVTRSWWADITVLQMNHPPGNKIIERLSSGIRTLILNCPRPLLIVPGQPSSMQRAVLAYDGSSKSREALFIATYIARRWKVALTILHVAAETEEAYVLDEVAAYLQQWEVAAEFLKQSGLVGETILETATTYQADLIIMGGYSRNPMLSAVINSTVDYVLRGQPPCPVLICR